MGQNRDRQDSTCMHKLYNYYVADRTRFGIVLETYGVEIELLKYSKYASRSQTGARRRQGVRSLSLADPTAHSRKRGQSRLRRVDCKASQPERKNAGQLIQY